MEWHKTEDGYPELGEYVLGHFTGRYGDIYRVGFFSDQSIYPNETKIKFNMCGIGLVSGQPSYWTLITEPKQ